VSRHRDRPSQLSPEGRRDVREYKEGELRRFLVEDAVRHHATWLPWATAAYERIGKLSGKGAEVAYVSVVEEVMAVTGNNMLVVNQDTGESWPACMPISSLTEVELRKLTS
jgi:hypothetical protein